MNGFSLCQAVLASTFAKKDYEKVKATTIRVLQVNPSLDLDVTHCFFHALNCLCFCSAVGFGIGVSAILHHSSCITVSFKIIYNGHQCFESHQYRHSGISVTFYLCIYAWHDSAHTHIYKHAYSFFFSSVYWVSNKILSDNLLVRLFISLLQSLSPSTL